GDSEPRPDVGVTELARAGLDYADAMRLLETKRQLREFLVAGLCSGVDPIHALTRDDPRVVGAAFIDGYAYPTRGLRIRRALRYADLARWRRWRSLRKLVPRAIVGERPDVFDRTYPTREAMRADVEE